LIVVPVFDFLGAVAQTEGYIARQRLQGGQLKLDMGLPVFPIRRELAVEAGGQGMPDAVLARPEHVDLLVEAQVFDCQQKRQMLLYAAFLARDHVLDVLQLNFIHVMWPGWDADDRRADMS